MEQTSSAAYPNILVVDYVKKARVASPQLLAKAEQFLQVGYQKLLTFERPGGGFVDRTQQWLLKQRAADGTWSTVGGTHGETIDRMGSAKLVLTSFVVWSL